MMIFSCQKQEKDADYYLKEGLANDKSKNYTIAIENYNKAIELNPKFTLAYYNRGMAKAFLQNYTDALSDYNKAIELNPKYPVAFYNRGIAKYYLGNSEGACNDWRRASELGVDEANENIQKYCK
jgi:tetratricopeptide (TPR) repeat protein